MKEFQISRYIKKWLPWIIIVCMALTTAVYVFLSSMQTYVASAVIRYEGENAAIGLTPTGETLDVEQIKSSSVVSQVIRNLGLDKADYSVDSIISGITIEEVIDEDEQMRKEALLDEGQEYQYEPVTYIVSFEAGGKENEYFAREVLDEILDVYFEAYSEQYVNNSYTINPLTEINSANYDYIEMMEIIDSSVESTLEAFARRTANGNNFRAASTGMSFSDLTDRFYYIQSVDISKLFSKILEHQVTKDKNLLTAKYRERISNNQITGDAEEEKIQDVLVLIDAYVEKMRQSGNTNITYEYILDDVYEKELLDSYGNVVGDGDQTVTYDKLIFSWRDHKQTEAYALIDSAYCQYILQVFGQCLGICGGIPSSVSVSTGTGADMNTVDVSSCSASDKTCSAFDDQSYADAVSEIEEGIDGLITELSELYAITEKTNDEYNKYLGAAYISTLSSVSVEKGLNVMLYTAIAAVFLLVICGCCAILLGRLNDIIQYVFYTDALTGLNNRNAFDSYLKGYDHRLLDDKVACMAINILNQPEVNKLFGREEGDKLIKFFAEALKEAVSKDESYFVYNGKAQFIAVIEDTDRASVDHMIHRFSFIVDRRDLLKNAEIEYEVGAAESSSDSSRTMRSLLSAAMNNTRRFKSIGV